MALTNALLIADVTHARTRPKKNAFCYRVYYLCIALSELPLLHKLAVFSLNRPNLFSLYEKNYGKDSDPQSWIRSLLREWQVNEADGEVVLLTLPRVLGYAFNPVSFWFCLDRAGALRAVLSEVTNTFGERHCYLSFHDDRRAIGEDDWLCANKVFHVSPYIEVKGRYEFRFVHRENKVAVWINYFDEDGLMLTTSVTGKRHPLTSPALLRCFFMYPMVTIKVIALIHYHALKLFAKGVRYRVKPSPPATEISR